MPGHRLHHSGELDVFDATLYFSGGLDFPAAHRPAGQPIIRNIPPPALSHFTEIEKAVRGKERSKQPSSPRVKLASFVNSIFHQTKSKPKSTHTPQAPKPLKTRPPLYPNIPKMELRCYDSCKNGIDGISLVHQARLNQKSTTDFDEFVVYKGIRNKGTDEFLKDAGIWATEALSSIQERRSSRRAKDQRVDDDGDCNQRQSVCSSDLFELENYKL